MADAPKSPKFFEPFKQYAKADGRDLWEPEKYQRLMVYIVIYNYIKQNLRDFAPQYVEGELRPSKYKDDSGNFLDFGLHASALSTEINESIRKNLKWFVKKLGINDPVTTAGTGFDINLNETQFLTEFDGYVQECNEMVASGTLPNHKAGEPLTTEEGLVLLRAKEEKVREWFDHIRNSVEGKPFDVNSEGKPIGGYRTIAVTKAEMQKKENLAQIAKTGGDAVFRSLVTAGGGGLTIGSVMLLASGGPVIAALLGAVAGFKITKTALSKTVTALGKEAGLIKEHFEFMHGIGNYAPQNGIPRGYNAIKLDYEKGQAMKMFFTKFKTPLKESDFNAKFEEHFNKMIEENKKVLSKADIKFIESKKEKIKFVLQVSDGEKYKIRSDGKIVHCGASKFGKARALASKHIAINREDYKLDNVNELNRMITGEIGACKTIEDLYKGLQFLTEHKAAYTSIQREHEYNEHERSYASKAADAINFTAFDEPLSIDTIQNLSDAISNPKIAEVIKNGGFADKTKDFKSVEKFIENENLENSVSTNLSTSLSNQITFTKAAMMAALTSESFGSDKFIIGTPDYLAAEKVVEAIIGYGEVDSTTAALIDSQIAALPSPLGHTYDYLKFMWQKKQNEAKYNKSYTAGIIKTAPAPIESAWDFKEVISYCGGFGKDGVRSGEPATSDLYSRLAGIVTTITSSTSPIDYDLVKVDIEDAFNGRPKLKEYLLYVLDSKTGKIGNSADVFAEKIANLSEADLSTDKASQLNTLIMSSNLSDKAKILASSILEKQVSALKNKRNNESKVYMMDVLRKGSYDNFEEYSSKITGLTTIAQLDDQETRKFYEETILKISDTRIRNYFIALFETNAKRVINAQINENIEKNIYSGTDGLKKLTEFFTTIKGYKYFDDLTKSEFIEELSGYISTSFETILRDYYEHPIMKAGDSKILADYKRKAYSEGGLKEFLFESPTQDSKVLKMQIDNVNSNINELVEYMTGISGGHEIKEENDTTMVVGRIFFDKLGRNNDDPLKKSLSRTKSAVSSNAGYLISGEPDASANLITALNIQIANAINTFAGANIIDTSGINESTMFSFDDLGYNTNFRGKTRNSKDLLAALLAIKRHMMICYKNHLNQFLQKQLGYTPSTKQSDIVDNLAGTSTTSTTTKSGKVSGKEFEKIKTNWEVIFKSIDDICNELTNDIKDVEPGIFEGTSYKRAMELITKTDPTQAINIATSADLEKM